MTWNRDRNCASAPQYGGPVMTLPDITDVQCEALFASTLQGSDAVTAEAAKTAISSTVRQLGRDGCASRMAQEFGDHPESARDRMRWARHLVGELSHGAAAPATGTAGRAA
jgi:hypothetical protein